MAEATTNRRSIEVLATHDAETTYTGIQERRCMFMTSLCPDHCNHANKWALFRVDKVRLGALRRFCRTVVAPHR